MFGDSMKENFINFGPRDCKISNKSQCKKAVSVFIFIRKRLNGGTVPPFKMHPGGTVPPFKMHPGDSLKFYDILFDL